MNKTLIVFVPSLEESEAFMKAVCDLYREGNKEFKSFWITNTTPVFGSEFARIETLDTLVRVFTSGVGKLSTYENLYHIRDQIKEEMSVATLRKFTPELTSYLLAGTCCGPKEIEGHLTLVERTIQSVDLTPLGLTYGQISNLPIELSPNSEIYSLLDKTSNLKKTKSVTVENFISRIPESPYGDVEHTVYNMEDYPFLRLYGENSAILRYVSDSGEARSYNASLRIGMIEIIEQILEYIKAGAGRA